MTKLHGYMEGNQFAVVTGSGDYDYDLFLLRGNYIYLNNGDAPVQHFDQKGTAYSAGTPKGMASALGAELHPDRDTAVAAYFAKTPDPDWQEVAEKTFGPDWIAPLSEVLRINRRTVERWRSGAVVISEEVRQRIIGLRRNDLDFQMYGSILRRVAAGEDVSSILHQADEIVGACHAYLRALEARDPVALSAAGEA